MYFESIEIEDVLPIPPVGTINQKEVYAFFGLAAYTAQCLEKELVIFAMTYKCLDKDTLTQDEWLSLHEKLNSETFGKLLHAAKERGTIPVAIEKQLKKSLRMRNWLFHDFFLDKAVTFCDEDGMKSMISELRDLIHLFHVTDKILSTIRRKAMKNVGITKDLIEREMETQLHEYRRSKDASQIGQQNTLDGTPVT